MVSAYLLGLMILMVNVWDIMPFCLIPSDLYLVGTIAYLLLGVVVFPRKRFSLLMYRLIPFWIIILGILLSFIPASLFHGQSIVQSVLSYRAQMLWVVIPMLIRLHPSKNAVFQATFIFTVLMFIVTVMHMLVPAMFMEVQNDLLYDEYAVPGLTVAFIPLMIALERISHKFNRHDFAIVIFCLVFFFVVQNRTSIFASAILVGFMMLKFNNRYKYLIISLMVVFAAAFVALTISTWIEMFNETVTQIGDVDYNRNKAFIYFFSPLANPSFLTYILGNGFLSAHSSPLMADLMSEGIYNSDVGYVGFWNQFGILPIISFIYLICKGMIVNRSSVLAQGSALLMLLTSISIGYYGGTTALLSFAFFYYYITEKPQISTSR